MRRDPRAVAVQSPALTAGDRHYAACPENGDGFEVALAAVPAAERSGDRAHLHC
ncbi:hypothetical protein ACWD1Z_26405 [Streptomyces sp. NPDC002784]